MKKHILVFLFLIFFLWGQAQKTIQPKGLEYEYKGIVYNTEQVYHFSLHTNGFKAGMDFGKLLTYYKTRYYHFSIGYLRHPLESSFNKNINFEGLGSSRSFRFGKQNSFYQLRGGIGVKRYKSEKAKRRGIAVGWNYEVGPVIGVLRPVKNIYLIANDNSGIKSSVELSYEDDPETFLNYDALFGRSSSFDSWAQLKLRPGIQAQVAGHFSMGAFDQYVKALEVGIMVDYFGFKIPIMVENEAHSNDALFLNLFVSLHFGSRK